MRRTLRGSLRTGGDPIRLARRRRRRRAPAAGAAVRHLGLDGALRARLPAVPDLRRRRPAARRNRGVRVRHAADPADPGACARAIPSGRSQQAAATAPDWSSGTRIGDALKAFNDRHGRRGMARGAVVVILSDGWERGDPALVGREMERLRAPGLPDRVGQPAGGGAPASRRARAGWRRRCRTATRSSAATAWQALAEVVDAIAAERCRRRWRRVPAGGHRSRAQDDEAEPWAQRDAGAGQLGRDAERLRPEPRPHDARAGGLG